MPFGSPGCILPRMPSRPAEPGIRAVAPGAKPVVLIPAYQPDRALAQLVEELLARPEIGPIVVVDDGSGSAYRSIFERLRDLAGVHVLVHPANLGKGAALKTGMGFASLRFPEAVGVVTADADGQHTAEDVAQVTRALLESGGAVVIGARRLDRSAPLRSRVGNRIMRWAVRLAAGQKLSDTQTGLRGIPLAFIPRLLTLPAAHYDFETDMLLHCREAGWQVREVPIAAVYLNNNRGTHFRPLADSLRVYLVLVRFSALSLVTAALDNALFIALLGVTPYIGLCQALSRLTAGSFQFWAAKRGVFRSHAPAAPAIARFWLLCAATGASSYLILRGLLHFTSLGVVPAKLFAETLMFFASYVMQRELVFAHRSSRAL
jgi:putative flippase GtrA